MKDPCKGRVRIRSENDIVVARRTVRDAATQMAFGLTDVTRIVTAASELARNVFQYAGDGVMHWTAVDRNSSVGIELTFEDNGPGFSDIEQAMQRGYSTSNGLGLGLPGVKRLMDELEIVSQPGNGAKVTARKWVRK